MNTIEALQALVEGKKIRRTCWDAHQYIYLKDGIPYCQDNIEWPINEPIRFHREDWELYDGRVEVGTLKVGDKFDDCDKLVGVSVVLDREDIYLNHTRFNGSNDVPVFNFLKNEIFAVTKSQKVRKVK